AEREQLTAGLRSSDAFVLRRCQILLASARGERASQIARQVGCDDETVRRVIVAFNARGVAARRRGSSRPQRIHAAVDLARRALTHPAWVLGFEDEVWWSRLARPALHSWAEADQPLRLVEQTVAKDDPDPKALACYGLLVRGAAAAGGWQEETWLRFVAGRPV